MTTATTATTTATTATSSLTDAKALAARLGVRTENETPSVLDASRSRRGWSRIGPWFTCPQLFAYQEVLGLQFVATEPLLCGSLGHLLVAHHLAREGARCGGVIANDTLLTDPDALLAPEDAAEVWASENGATHLLGPMIETFRRFAKREIPGDVLCVEHELVGVLVHGSDGKPRLACATGVDMRDPDPRKWNLGCLDVRLLSNSEPVVITRRLDAVLREWDGMVRAWDHKHTGAPVDPARAQTAYALDGGFLAIDILAEQVWGDDYGGTRLNLIQRRPPYNIAQPLIGPRHALLDQFPALLLRAEQARVDAADADTDPFEYEKRLNEANGCEGKYGICPALNLCKHGRSSLAEYRTPR